MKEYSLLEEQKTMLSNLSFMLQSKDVKIINLARNLILEEPLISGIILINETRPLKTLFKHKILKYADYDLDNKIFNYWYRNNNQDYHNYCRIQQISQHMQDTINLGTYFMYK